MILINQYKKKDAADRNDLLYKNPCTSHAPVQIFGVFILIFMYFLKSSYLHERITKHVHIDVFYHNQKEKCKGFTLNPSFLKKRKRLTPFPPIFLKKRKPPPPPKTKKTQKQTRKHFHPDDHTTCYMALFSFLPSSHSSLSGVRLYGRSSVSYTYSLSA